MYEKKLVTLKTFHENINFSDPFKFLSKYLRFTSDSVEVLLDNWEEIKFPPNDRPFKAISKIALDPGHLGGEFSLLEKRDFSGVGEGDLNLAVTSLVGKELATGKCKIFQTRITPGPVRTKWATSSEIRLEEKLFYSLSTFSDQLSALTRSKDGQNFSGIMTRLDLSDRLKKISSFEPDLMLSIHFNANSDKSLTDHNGVMVFIPGCFSESELSDPSMRKSYLEILTTVNYNQLLAAAKIFLNEMRKHLELEAVKASMFEEKLRSNFYEVEEGIYLRNLVVLRSKSRLPMLLEGPFLNNQKENSQLKKELISGNYLRIRQYAEAVVEGIKKTEKFLT